MGTSALLWIAAGLVLVLIVMRVLFKAAGWIFKLLIIAAAGFAVWWLVTGR
jgi:hypothetical protein